MNDNCLLKFLQVIAIHDFVVNVVELTANWLLACNGAALLLWCRLFCLGIWLLVPLRGKLFLSLIARCIYTN